MAKSVRITKIDRRGQRCTLITFRGGGEKGQIEIPGGMGEFRDWIREQVKENAELLVALGLAQWLAKNPGTQDFTAIEGKQIAIDLEADASTGLVKVV